MSQNTEILLSLYKTYEGLVRAQGADVLQTEDALPELQSNQMRIIRQIRNFLSHNESPGFIEPTDKMLAFLNRQVIDWRMRGDVVQNHLKTPASGMCRDTDACADVLKKMSRLRVMKIAVLREKNGSVRLCGLFETASKLAADPQAVMTAVPSLKERPEFVSPDVLMTDIDPDCITICTKDGHSDSRIVGVVRAE